MWEYKWIKIRLPEQLSKNRIILWYAQGMMSSIKKDRALLDKIFFVIIEEKKTLGNKFVFERVLIFNWVSNLEVKTSGVVELVKKLLADI